MKKIYFILVVLLGVNTYAFTQCNNPDDYAALYALYNSTNGANWTDNSNWDVSTIPPLTPVGLDMSTWYGIVCNGGRVTKVLLFSNALSGTIPPQLGNLTNLESLHLEINQLTGSIPSQLGSLVNLTNLALKRNHLTGSIPFQLGNLTNLLVLDLGQNDLSGTIPTQLGNLFNLWILDLRGNQLSGSIPSQLGNLSSLGTLNFNGNNLTGNIPTQLGNLSNLNTLNLAVNDLQGSIPTQLGNLSNLETLNFNGNELTGNIPIQLVNLNNLKILNLSVNKLTGNIPSQLGNLSNLEILDFNSNFLSGSIPMQLGNLSNLRTLNFYSNGLTGSIPSQLGNLTNLEILNLYENSLSGGIPLLLGNLSSLETLFLGDNNFNGSIPSQLGNLSSLVMLNFEDNQLTGSIPSQLGNLSSLVMLNLEDNQLTGSIPISFNQLSNLSVFNLILNQLSGCYDPALKGGASVLCNFLNIDISAGNNFDAPWEDFCNSDAGKCVCDNPDDYAALYALYNSTNGVNWTNNTNWDVSAIPPAVPANLDMSNWFGISCKQGRITKVQLIINNMTGVIPPEMQKLSELTDLDLTVNNLSGNIPPELGNLLNIVHIDLGFNLLTGSIPNSFNQLSGLTYLVLSDNQLSGCYDPALKSFPSILCNFNDANISIGNSFDADWEDFCNFDSGNCCGTNIWNGNVDNNWETPGNWNKGYVPLDCQNVIISGVGTTININSVTAQAASISIVNGNTLNVKVGAVLTINGDLNTLSTDGINISGNNSIVNNTGTIICSNIKRRGLNINFGGVFNNLNSLQITGFNQHIQAYNGIEVYEMGQMSNTGSIIITSSVSNFDTDGISCKSSASFTNSGSINISNIQGFNSEAISNESTFTNKNGGIITINTVGNSFGLLNSSATAQFINNGSVSTTNTFSSGVRNANGAIFGGSGTATMNNFDNMAGLSPGNSPGVITLNGNLNNTDSYTVEINDKTGIGTGHDHIQVNGDVDLSGTLQIINNTPGGTLLNDDKFTILSYTGTRTGTFTDLKMDLFPADWTVTYDAQFCGKCIVVHGPNAALPVELSSFTLRKLDKTIELNWTVASAINNEGFEVQHSTDGQDWAEIGWVEDLGASAAVNAYRFLHQSPKSGYNYYRLRQLDFDGKFEYSTILSADFEAAGNITVYPNPAKDNLYISGKHLENARLDIFTTIGQKINATILNKTPDNIQIELSGLKNGVYLIHIQLENGEHFSKQVYIITE